MSASDCYSLALMLYNQEGPYNYKPYAAQWFEAARESFGALTDEPRFSVTEMMTYVLVSELHSMEMYF